MKFKVTLSVFLLTISLVPIVVGATDKNFNRIASFPVCSQLDATCNIDDETAAEIVAVGPFGHKLIYTDSPLNAVGFVGISHPKKPVGLGTTALAGEPTSVAVKGLFALVGVNTSEDFISVSGHLSVINLWNQKVVHTIDLGGQPDSVAISPSKKYAAVVIENERDEDLGNGEPPQDPAGELVIIDISKFYPKKWTTTRVDLTGLADLFPGDPEPEYVDINKKDIAVVTLQENNYIVLIDLNTGGVINHFSAGTVDLTDVDATEEDPAVINQTESLDTVPREPDGVAWINNHYFATADEGDLFGGSRGFTIFDSEGTVVYTSGSDLDHFAARLGHYPDNRSGNKGNEPENIEVGKFGANRLMFVNSERSSLVFVYNVNNPKKPVLQQVLPAGAGPEGGLAIPGRKLLVVASEVDDRGDKIRSVLNIYKQQKRRPAYPTLKSANRANGLPIPWGALSGLSASVNAIQVRFGFEGVAEYAGKVYVTIQRAWGDEANPRVAIYDSNTGTWSFVFYPLDEPESQNGGWVGLSEISSLGNGKFLVVERDNQGGPDAAIKRLYTIDLNGVQDGETISKHFIRDLIPYLNKTGALTYEKVEGLAVTPVGNVYITNDNDGVDDNSGETQLINLGKILK